MKSLLIRALAAATIGALAVILLAGAGAPARKAASGSLSKVVIVSTSDVKGKTSPCG